MQKPKKILVASDFSPTCERALKHAAALAARSGAELHVLNVQVLRSELYGWQTRPDMAEVDKLIEDAAREQMQDFVEGQRAKVVHEVIRDVQEAPAILRYAHEKDIDLIVMGTHARSGVSRMFLGSVAAEVLRVTDIPVLVIGSDHPVADKGYQRIVVAVDLSEGSASLLHNATALADSDNVQLRVVHVCEARTATPYYATEVTDEQRKKAEGEMEKLLEAASLPGKVESQVLAGLSEEQIVATAKDFDADLIVMGSASMSRMRRLLLGSTTDRVLRQAPCAVLAWRNKSSGEG
ncbi:MAG: universal stress protein [Rhodanobacteraceae bacterium]